MISRRYFPRGFRNRSMVAAIALGTISTILLIAILLISSGFGARRSFVVEARATGATILFKGNSNYWPLGPVTLCVPHPIDLKRPRGKGICDERRYEEQQEAELSISWPPDARLRVSSFGNEAIVLTLLNESAFPEGTRIIMQGHASERLLSLSFYGNATIGKPIASGETDILLSGSYEAREQPFWSETTEVLRDGKIRRGESVEIVRDKSQDASAANLFGHISADNRDDLGFLINLTSEAGQPVLKLVYFGGTQPIMIMPSWIDRALKSSLVLVLAFVLSLAGNLTQFSGSVLELSQRSKAPNRK